jgi:hypothetical protein
LVDLNKSGLISIFNDHIEITNYQKLLIALKAIELGADFEKITRSLGWLEFEEILAYVFEFNGFGVKKDLDSNLKKDVGK